MSANGKENGIGIANVIVTEIGRLIQTGPGTVSESESGIGSRMHFGSASEILTSIGTVRMSIVSCGHRQLLRTFYLDSGSLIGCLVARGVSRGFGLAGGR